MHEKHTLSLLRKTKKRNLLLTIAYDGTEYHGWQIQPNHLTVQGELEKTLEELTKEKIHLFAAGRTDRSVHAHGMTANFYTNASIPTKGFLQALNTYLPEDIRIMAVSEADLAFHARYHAIGKKYRYRVLNTELPNPFERNYSVWMPYGLDMEAMSAASKHLLGEHDFSSFVAQGSTVKSHVRRLYRIRITREESGIVSFEFFGNGFLYNMVRILVGTLIDIGKGKDYDLPELIKNKDRTLAGPTYAPQGLFLDKVYYHSHEMDFI